MLCQRRRGPRSRPAVLRAARQAGTERLVFRYRLTCLVKCGEHPLMSGRTSDFITKKFFRRRLPGTLRRTTGAFPAVVKLSFLTYLPEFRGVPADSSGSRSFHPSRPGSTEESARDCLARAFAGSF